MPCSRHQIGSPGETFRFRIMDAKNVRDGIGRLRETGPGIGDSRDFSFGELQDGVAWLLEERMSYSLRIVVTPIDAAEIIQITAQAGDTCSRDGAGQIAEWLIDVL
jgi:hypothetical protein